MATKRKEPEQEEEETTAFDDSPPAPRKTATDELIEHYKQEAARRDTIPYCYLYKYDDPKTGNEMQQVGKFAGEEIPDPHNIGIRFGAGRYGIKLYTAKGKAESSKQDWGTFKIHPIYDEYKAKADVETHNAEIKRFTGQQPTGNIPSSGIAEPFLMVKEILAMILPIITAATRTAGTPGGARQETPAEMLNSYAMMQKLLKTNLFDTAETLKQYSQRYIAAPAQDDNYEDETDDQQPKEKNVVLKIIEMIEPFFGLIASKSPAATLAAQGLRAAPQVMEILQDSGLCRIIVQHFDRTKGRAAADLALKNIGIDREKLFAQQQLPPANGKKQPLKIHQTTGTAPKTTA